VLCFGNSTGSINLTVNGGFAPYTYFMEQWRHTQDISSLSSGSFNVTVTDANACTASLNDIVISQPAPIENIRRFLQHTRRAGNTLNLLSSATGGTGTYPIAGVVPVVLLPICKTLRSPM
jgi:hypothetical protein